MIKKIISLLILLLSLMNCKFVQFGIPPLSLDKDLPFKKGNIYFNEEDLNLHYVITTIDVTNDSSNSLIFYMHGLGRTELEWVEDKGFGSHYYETLKENPQFKSFPVVSISLGNAYLFIDNAPPPYNADLEKLFIDKIVPYFKKLLNCNGKIYLMGHSMGGYNALSLALRHPDEFPAIVVVSPFVAPISPFDEKFHEMGKKFNMPEFQINLLENILKNAFKTEENWIKYSPYNLLEKKDTNKSPFIFISDAKNDLPGFEWSIDDFVSKLYIKKSDYYFCKSDGDHRTTCKNLFYKFLEKTSENKK